MEVVVIGAGGHAVVVVSTLQEAGMNVVASLDDAASRHGDEILGVRVVGSTDVRQFDGALALVAIGDNAIRHRVVDRLGNRFEWMSVVHPRAYVHPSVRIGVGTVVFAGAVVQPQTRLGEHVIINTGAAVDHDCEIGSFAHIAPGSHLAGQVGVGDGVLLGIGSSAAPGVRIGSWATIGAGATVIKDLPGDAVAVGTPARVMNGR